MSTIPSPGDTSRAPFRVLVVEDELELNELLCYNLERAGHQASGTFDGDDALKLIAASPPDLILLDLMLPSRDGWSVCRALQQDERTRDIDIIVFTARGSREDFDTAQTFPAIRGYFVKPYMTDDVLRHIEKIFRRDRRV